MKSEKAAVLVETIIARSAQGKIPWTESSSEDAFEASLPSATVRVVKEELVDSDGDPFTLVSINIVNTDGRVVETITPYTVRQHVVSGNEKFRNLFSEARDCALGVDAAVENLLKDLGGPAGGYDESLDDEEIPF